MNSLLKQPIEIAQVKPETFMATFEHSISIASLSEAELLMKKLKFLGLNFDPFAPETSDECQQIMDNLALTEQLKNPYLATNILLRLLDKTEERINYLKQ